MTRILLAFKFFLCVLFLTSSTIASEAAAHPATNATPQEGNLAGLPPDVQAALNAAETPQSNTASIHIDAATNLYKGLPYFVAITMKNGGAMPVKLREWNPLQANFPLTVKLQSANGHEYSSVIGWENFLRGWRETNLGPKPIFYNSWKLASGESVRSLANLGSILAQFDLPPGTYSFSVHLWSEPNKPMGESKTISINVTERPMRELSSLSAAANLTVLVSDLKQNLAIEELARIQSKDLRETLAFCSLLREIGTAKDISAIRVGGYKQVIGAWALPELEEIEYEVLLAQGKKSQATLVRDSLLKRFPAMKYWADGAQGDGGLCRTIRDLHAYGR